MGIDSVKNPAEEEAAKAHAAKMERQRTVDAKVVGIRNNPGENRSEEEIRAQAEKEADVGVTEVIFMDSDLAPEDLAEFGLNQSGLDKVEEHLNKLTLQQLFAGMKAHDEDQPFTGPYKAIKAREDMFRLYLEKIREMCEENPAMASIKKSLESYEGKRFEWLMEDEDRSGQEFHDAEEEALFARRLLEQDVLEFVA